MTGAEQGIGRAIAELFERESASLVVNDIVRRAEQRPIGVFVEGDISRPATARAAVEAAVSNFGRVDVLVNNAAIGGSAHGDGPVTTSDEAAWDKILRVNVTSVMLCCRYAIPEMVRTAGGGSVVNMASVLALAGCSEHFTSHAYVASKGAIVSLTRALAAYYAAQKIRVNALCPGLIDTPLSAKSRERPDALRYVTARQRLTGTMGTAADVARAALFLASDDSAFITGAILPVDGGWSTGV